MPRSFEMTSATARFYPHCRKARSVSVTVAETVQKNTLETCSFDSTGRSVRSLTSSRKSVARSMGMLRRRLKTEIAHVRMASNRADVCTVCRKFDKMVVPNTRAPGTRKTAGGQTRRSRRGGAGVTRRGRWASAPPPVCVCVAIREDEWRALQGEIHTCAAETCLKLS